MNLIGETRSGAAGFYAASLGPVPFAIGSLPRQNYFVVKVFPQVQFNTRPTNPREVQAGEVPAYSGVSMLCHGADLLGPETIKQAQIAQQLAEEENRGSHSKLSRMFENGFQQPGRFEQPCMDVGDKQQAGIAKWS